MDKILEPYTSDSSKISVHLTNQRVFTIIVSNEDVESIMRLNIQAQTSRGIERCLIWTIERKSLSLTRFIKETADPRDDMMQLYVRYLNGDSMDYRRENLVWSISPSGKIRLPQKDKIVPKVDQPKVLIWNGQRLLFQTEAERNLARRRLEQGEPLHHINQTGRKRERNASIGQVAAGRCTADWARWLRGRSIELGEIRDLLANVRPPYSFEDWDFVRIARDAWKGFNEGNCKLLAYVTAMWMDRRAQAEPDLDKNDPGNERRAITLLKTYTYRDPFEDVTDSFSEFVRTSAYIEMPRVTASFSLPTGIE